MVDKTQKKERTLCQEGRQREVLLQNHRGEKAKRP